MNNKILLVEDDPDYLIILRDALRRNGFNVFTAASGEEGVKLHEKERPDLIIADVMMPGMNGFEMMKRIRQSDKSVLLFFLTAKADMDDVMDGFDLACSEYLKKPFEIADLLIRIRVHLQRRLPQEKTSFDIGQYVLRIDRQTLTFQREDPKKLAFLDALLLKELILHVGETLKVGDLIMLLWQQKDDAGYRNSLHGIVHRLRTYLRHDKSIGIINQRNIGYMLTINGMNGAAEAAGGLGAEDGMTDAGGEIKAGGLDATGVVTVFVGGGCE